MSDEVYGNKYMGDHIQGDKVQGDKIAGDVVQGDKHVHIYQEKPVSEKPSLPLEPETVIVPAGAFLMGDNEDPLTTPAHTIFLPEYAIGVFPVTNQQYAQFVWKSGGVAAKEMLWDGNQPPSDQLRFPATGVTWFEALAFCEWLSAETGRVYALPSEAHWEKAARGIDGRFFPWGNDWQPDRCHSAAGSFAPVDKYPAQSPYGCYDMVGNAREWTATLWGSASREPDLCYRYPWLDDGRNDLNAPATTRRIYRGGRGDEPAAYRCAKRGSQLPDRPGPRRNRHGFRVMLVK